MTEERLNVLIAEAWKREGWRWEECDITSVIPVLLLNMRGEPWLLMWVPTLPALCVFLSVSALLPSLCLCSDNGSKTGLGLLVARSSKHCHTIFRILVPMIRRTPPAMHEVSRLYQTPLTTEQLLCCPGHLRVQNTLGCETTRMSGFSFTAFGFVCFTLLDHL